MHSHLFANKWQYWRYRIFGYLFDCGNILFVKTYNANNNLNFLFFKLVQPGPVLICMRFSKKNIYIVWECVSTSMTKNNTIICILGNIFVWEHGFIHAHNCILWANNFMCNLGKQIYKFCSSIIVMSIKMYVEYK